MILRNKPELYHVSYLSLIRYVLLVGKVQSVIFVGTFFAEPYVHDISHSTSIISKC